MFGHHPATRPAHDIRGQRIVPVAAVDAGRFPAAKRIAVQLGISQLKFML